MHNFNAGPSILPSTVLEAAAQAIRNFNGSGLSLLEIGHRTKLFEPVMQEARQLVRELMQLHPDQEVLFLHGGASTQFMQVPMNLLPSNGKAAYTDTGIWSAKAIKEATHFGTVEIAGSAKDGGYREIPKTLEMDPTAQYFHLTTNETVHGLQWQQLPLNVEVPLVADMSSDVLSRTLPFDRFGLIYAGAQKNMGAAGVNLVVVNKNLLGKADRRIPTMMDYREHIREASMINTPPVFAVYVALLTLRWVKEQGGIPEMEKRSRQRSQLLYETLDACPVFECPVNAADRSRMNAVFTIKDSRIEEAFANRCAAEGMIGIKGHRSVGGFRVSLYNALPLESVVALTNLMKEFARQHG
ncbi:MAG: 3-phosphoserine/phosphohydroxythreonine transaminase [Bacteroidetes bacterium]|nr:3-phosphoserine/phosphohydroxythreonine transaminase [Bacteroidota bacterium]